jgi:transcription antitermination factor NusG
MPPSKHIWYAAYTKSNSEKKVAVELAKIGVEHYLPLQWTIRQWSDRRKKVQVPLINSYIFVHIKPKEHMRVVLVPGIVKIIHFSGKPVAIPEWQIQNLRILMGAQVQVNSEAKDFEKGEDVRISHGPLTGLRGKILHFHGHHKLVISIDALDYNLTIDIDPVFVETMG